MSKNMIITAGISFAGEKYGVSIWYMNGSNPDKIRFTIWIRNPDLYDQVLSPDFQSVTVSPDNLATLLLPLVTPNE